MTGLSIVLGALLIAAPAYAQQDAAAANSPSAKATAPADSAAEKPSGFDLARLKLAQCSGERFDFEVADQPGARGTKVSLCSNAGASKEEIAAMLESAIRQLESTDRISASNRDQVVAQIRAKLVEVQSR